jgi:hypothetical protein
VNSPNRDNGHFTWTVFDFTCGPNHDQYCESPIWGYIVLLFLDVAVIVVVIVAWFAILFTGRYPRGIFAFVEGVIRWHNRVIAYAFVLITDRYPPFSLAT